MDQTLSIHLFIDWLIFTALTVEEACLFKSHFLEFLSLDITVLIQDRWCVKTAVTKLDRKLKNKTKISFLMYLFNVYANEKISLENYLLATFFIFTKIEDFQKSIDKTFCTFFLFTFNRRCQTQPNRFLRKIKILLLLVIISASSCRFNFKNVCSELFMKINIREISSIYIMVC